jgi:hypothetical protein
MLDQLLKHDAHIDRCRLTKAKIWCRTFQ